MPNVTDNTENIKRKILDLLSDLMDNNFDKESAIIVKNAFLDIESNINDEIEKIRDDLYTKYIV
jgi:hypothetical protein